MVAARNLPSRILKRASKAGAPVGQELAERLAAYLELLARWNDRINLTGLPVDPPTDEAIDRLLVEPVAAARYVEPHEALVLDVGSGGGSPALPLKLAVPRLRFVLVESKARKAAFLREAVRHLALEGVEVEHRRLEDVPPRTEHVDLVTVRAVRIDRALMATLRRFVEPHGRVFAFTAADSKLPASGEAHVLVPERRSYVVIARPLFGC